MATDPGIARRSADTHPVSKPYAYAILTKPDFPLAQPVGFIDDRTSPLPGPRPIPARHHKLNGRQGPEPIRYGFVGLYPVKRAPLAGKLLQMGIPTRHLDSRSGGG